MAKSSQPKASIGERSAKTGRFVPDGTAEKRPNTTVRERIPLPGYGDTGRSSN